MLATTQTFTSGDLSSFCWYYFVFLISILPLDSYFIMIIILRYTFLQIHDTIIDIILVKVE